MAGNYIVSARKYRPDNFKSIVGQTAVSSTLKSAILTDKVAHAYLFCGPRGVGKTTAARVLAKTINCTDRTAEGEACSQCESCLAFEEQRSYNIFELDAASNNSVEDIRTLNEQVNISPAFGRYKVYIIDEVHMLSSAAFNAFLKTLEEPPKYAIFILATTEKHKILPTILSRCQIFDFKRIGTLDIVHHLAYVAQSEGVEAQEEALALIAEKADGGMRDALSMFDRIVGFSQEGVSYETALSCLNLLDYNDYIKFVEYLLRGEYKSVLLLLNDLFARGFDGLVILQGFTVFLRDLMVAQFPDTQALLEKPERVKELYTALAQHCATEVLYASLGEFVQAELSYRASTNKRLLVEMTFLKLVPIFQEKGFATGLVKPNNYQGLAEGTSVIIGSGVPAPAQATAPQPQANQEPTPTAPQTASPSPKPTAEVKEVKAQPQATEEPKVVVSERRVRRRPKIGSLISGDFTSELSETKTEGIAQAQAEVVENEPFTQEDLERAWQAFYKTQFKQTEAMEQSLMSDNRPELKENNVVEIAMPDSQIVKDNFGKVIVRLLPFLKKQLRNSAISIELISYTDTDKVERRRPMNTNEREQEMLEMNPILGLFKEQLNLMRS